MGYQAGIIGAGGIAGMGILGMHPEEDIGRKKFRSSHAGGYDACDGIELIAVADTVPEKLERFGDAWDVPPGRRYDDHQAMLEAEDLEVVSVATPTFLHRDHVIEAARTGDPAVIWCEKPIASSVSDAEEMVDVCDDENVELVVNHSFRFTDKLRRLHDLLHEEDLLGDVKSVHAAFRRELLRNSTHLLDTLVYLLDAEAETITGYLNGENDAVEALDGEPVDDQGGGGTVVMDDGAFVTVDCTLPRPISSMLFRFIGTEGKLSLNNDDGEWRYWRFDDGNHVEAPLPGIDGAWTWEEDYREAFPKAVEHILDLLEGTAENHSPGREAIRSLEIITGFYVSHYSGGAVSLPLDRPLRDITITSW